MPRGDRPPSFPFYPADWLADTNVALMSPAARAGHLDLMCHAWPTGRLPLDDQQLAVLSRLGPELWASCRDEILRAWAIEDDSHIIQRRLVEERRAQKRRRERAIEGGRQTQRILSEKRLTSTPPAGQLDLVPSLAGAPSFSSSSSSSSSSSESRTNTLARRAARADWQQAFDLFWLEYPRTSSGKSYALQVWMRYAPATAEAGQRLFDWIIAGLEHHKAGDWKDIEKKFIPLASTWLSRRSWTDAPNPNEERST